MKKIKNRLIVAVAIITMLVTLLLASTFSIGGGDSEWSALWNGGPSCSYSSSNPNLRYGFLVSDVTAADYNNIYCIEHGDALESKKTVSWWSGYSNLYNVTAVVTITGHAEGRGYVQYYDGEDNKFWFGNSEGVNSGSELNPGMHNRILASILNNYIDDDYNGRGMWIGNRKWTKLYIFSTSII